MLGRTWSWLLRQQLIETDGEDWLEMQLIYTRETVIGLYVSYRSTNNNVGYFLICTSLNCCYHSLSLLRQTV